MRIEGQLDIQMDINHNGKNSIDIRSSRSVYASQVFHGKSINESLTMLPLIFSICGVAQACAGVRACEQALGLNVPNSIEQLREKLVNMETLREHLWRILLDWPNLLNSIPTDKGLPEQKLSDQKIKAQEMSEVLKLQRDYREFLTDGHNPFLLEQNFSLADKKKNQPLAKLRKLLEQSVFAMSVATWLEINNLEKLQNWFESSSTIAARFLKVINQNNWQSLGRNEIKGFPPRATGALDIHYLHTQFKQEAFIKQPQWFNACCETSSLTRVESPLLDLLYQQFGNGLMVRLVARLTEMAQILENLLNSRDSCKNTMAYLRGKIVLGEGFGVVNAARGFLLHHVCIDNKQIQKYQILAPTEWNFHPQGVVTQSLASLQGDKQQIKCQADLLINAIDPCVAYNLSV